MLAFVVYGSVCSTEAIDATAANDAVCCVGIAATDEVKRVEIMRDRESVI